MYLTFCEEVAQGKKIFLRFFFLTLFFEFLNALLFRF